ncbi:MAG: VTT domain-containing protein [Candidatus Moraniibacteriota bacterium]
MITPDFHHHFQDISPAVHFIRNGSYFGIFLFSIVASYIFPIPEAIFLLLVGYVAKITGMNLIGVIALSTSGIIIGDNILYRLSFFGNKYVERFNRKMRKHKLIQYEHLVTDNVAFSVYFLKFVAGVRFFGPVILGSLRASRKKFVIHNAIASLLHTVLLIILGYYFHKKIVTTIAGVEIFKNVLLFSSAVIVGFIISLAAEKIDKKSS